MERYIEIPEEVREVYKLWRPTPLLRARRLEKALGTPAHIYYKYEGTSPSGSHKSNTAVAQAFYNKISGTQAMTTETAPVNGVRRLPWHVNSLGWGWKCIWCGYLTSKNLTATT